MSRLLLVKLGSIGDVVMAIPAAHLMHKAGYTIDWVVSDAIAPVLELYPWINVLPVSERALLRSGTAARVRALAGLWRRLRRGGPYDLCVTLYYDHRYRLLALPVRARRKVQLSHSDRTRALLPGRHHTDEYARVLTGRADTETPAQLAPIRAEGLPAPPLAAARARPRIVLVPGGARNLLRDDALRRWPVESYTELASLLLQRGCEVVLAGGPEDAWTSPSFAGLPVTNLIGELSLVNTLALLDSAEATVSHDTGPLHLAGLTSTSIVALFGPTDPRGRLPQRCGCVALWGGEGFACRPCYDGQTYALCGHNGCIRQISAAMVLAEVYALLAARREGRLSPPRIVTPEHTPSPTFVPLRVGAEIAGRAANPHQDTGNQR